MADFHSAQRRGFVKGGGTTYICRCCKRTTRPTGTGDNDSVQLCVECYDLAGEENHFDDNENFYSSPESIIKMIESVKAKGGDAKCWDKLKETAEKIIASY